MPEVAQIAAGVLIGLPLFVMLVACARGYRRYRPGHVIVVYGLIKGGRTSAIHTDSGVFVWPIIQGSYYMDLGPFELEEGQIRVNPEDFVSAAITTTGLTADEVQQHLRRWIDKADSSRESIAAALLKKGYTIEFRGA